MKFLWGKRGDKIIAWLSAFGYIFRKPLRALASTFFPSRWGLPKQYSRALPSYPPGVGKNYPPIWPTLHGRLNPLGQNSNDGFCRAGCYSTAQIPHFLRPNRLRAGNRVDRASRSKWELCIAEYRPNKAPHPWNALFS